MTAEVGVVLIAHVRRHRGFLELAQRVDEVDRLWPGGAGGGGAWSYSRTRRPRGSTRRRRFAAGGGPGEHGGVLDGVVDAELAAQPEAQLREAGVDLPVALSS